MRNKAKYKLSYDFQPDKISVLFYNLINETFHEDVVRYLGISNTTETIVNSSVLPERYEILLVKPKETKCYMKDSDSMIIRERVKRKAKIGDKVFYIKVGNFKTKPFDSAHDIFVQLNTIERPITCLFLCAILDDTSDYEHFRHKLMFNYVKDGYIKKINDRLVVIKPNRLLKNRFQYYSFLNTDGQLIFHQSIKYNKTVFSFDFLNSYKSKTFNNHKNNIIFDFITIYKSFILAKDYNYEFELTDIDTNIKGWNFIQKVTSLLSKYYGVKTIIIEKRC